MGCDIHYVVERKLKCTNRWIGIYSSNLIRFENRPLGKVRNYHFFANLAGVRGTPDKNIGGRYQNFLPPDISDLALEEITLDGIDGHSHSHISLDEFVDLYMKSDPLEKPEEYHKVSMIVGIYKEDEYNNSKYEDVVYRIIFWFDN